MLVKSDLPRRRKELRTRCKEVVQLLEGIDGESLICQAEDRRQDTTAALLYTVYQEAIADYHRARLYDQAFDGNVFVAHRVLLYLTAWHAWVAEAKSRNANKPKEYRDGWAQGARLFSGDLRLAVEAGHALVDPLLRKREVDRRPVLYTADDIALAVLPVAKERDALKDELKRLKTRFRGPRSR